jgi:NADPH:quinone reductase-like Zn-dependent oxidoreductase
MHVLHVVGARPNLMKVAPVISALKAYPKFKQTLVHTGQHFAHREQVEKSLLGKALARPDLVRQVVDFARTAGVKAAYQKVQSRLDMLAPLRYSCAGVVIAAGQGVAEFQPGDRVACAGAGYASHCEVNFIPKNLAVRIPDGVSLEAASLSAIGAIALQGFRQSQAVLGEVVAVIGAGLVGVLTIQLAKAAGCRVIAIDRDIQRVERARQFGADLALGSADRDTPSRVQAFARYGADVAIITAASPSAEPVELAASISRDRGRIVVVGTVDLGVSRKAMYMKEPSLVLSGPTDRAATILSTKKMAGTIRSAMCAGRRSATWKRFSIYWLRGRFRWRPFSSGVARWSREARPMRS